MNRYRPRVLTLVVLLVVAASIVLANLTYDQARFFCHGGDFSHKSYGWPLVWHRFVAVHASQHRGDIGWYYSAGRLAANLAMWLALLIAPAAACEWLVRRYRPRLRWSLRTMLAAMGLVAAFLAWFAAARERANLQDPIIARNVPRPGAPVWFERWGPKWLDLVGADRFRRRIIFARVDLNAGKGEDLLLLERLRRLPKMQHLEIIVDHVTPAVANAIRELRQVTHLSIEEEEKPGDDDRRDWAESLASIAKMTQLEYFHLSLPTARGRGLAQLAGLAKLKSLRLDGFEGHNDAASLHECLEAVGAVAQLEYLELNWVRFRAEALASLAALAKLKLLSLEYVRSDGPSLLAHLPPLAELEAVNIKSSLVADEDLRRLAVLPQLKSLGLIHLDVSAAGLNLGELAPLESLEEVAIDGDKTSSIDSYVSAVGVESLPAIKRLRVLHWGRNQRGPVPWTFIELDHGATTPVFKDDLDRCRRALQALRKSHPGIVVDSNTYAITTDWRHRGMPPYDYDLNPWRDSRWLPAPYLGWMTPAEQADFEKSEGWASFDGAGIREDNGHVFATSF